MEYIVKAPVVNSSEQKLPGTLRGKMQYRTSISLPENLIKKLDNATITGYSPSELVLFCLQKFIRRKRITEISDRPTCLYNQSTCGRMINVWFSQQVHHNLKMYRVITGESVSFMAAQALENFLDGLVVLLKTLWRKWKRPYGKIWIGIQHTLLSSIKRVYRFGSSGGRGILGFHMILTRPGIIWSREFAKIKTPQPMPPGLRERLGNQN